ITCFFFFFQAEDGIRDFHVTGVQTCALPIFPHETSLRTPHFFPPTYPDQCQSPPSQTAPPMKPLKCSALPQNKPGRESTVPRPEIGRASCRERGVGPGGSATSKEHKQQEHSQ